MRLQTRVTLLEAPLAAAKGESHLRPIRAEIREADGGMLERVGALIGLIAILKK
jgi:hypothetical protein